MRLEANGGGVPASSSTPLIARGIRKGFPGVLALRSANLVLKAGEIHALVGANGAGKSTLVKVLTGATSPDRGEILIDGHRVDFHDPGDSLRAGIAAIFQEFSLVPTLTVRANLHLGREFARAGFVDQRLEKQSSDAILRRVGLDMSTDRLVRDLSVAHQQLVEIGRALARNARILILDEPTASLSPREVQLLFTILRDLASHGIAILFISHRLEEVLSIASRVTVMRDGETLNSNPVEGLTRQDLVAQLVGHEFSEDFPTPDRKPSKIALEVQNLSGYGVRDVSFTASVGEVLGIAGLVGAGRTELARLIFGADGRTSGKFILHGVPMEIHSPHDAIGLGIGLLTEDRKSQGLVLQASAQDNFALGNLPSWSRFGWINRRKESERFRVREREVALRVSSPTQPAAELSGGNQQKLLVARWLEKECRVLIFDEPTRGIDIGAKREIHLLIRRLASQGQVIIVISSDFLELLGICDRILVMRRGQVAGEITDVTSASQDSIMAMAV